MDTQNNISNQAQPVVQNPAPAQAQPVMQNNQPPVQAQPVRQNPAPAQVQPAMQNNGAANQAEPPVSKATKISRLFAALALAIVPIILYYFFILTDPGETLSDVIGTKWYEIVGFIAFCVAVLAAILTAVFCDKSSPTFWKAPLFVSIAGMVLHFIACLLLYILQGIGGAIILLGLIAALGGGGYTLVAVVFLKK